MDANDLVEGAHYRVVMFIPGYWNAPREAVMKYLGRNGSNLVFDLGPDGGTKTFDAKYVFEIELTDEPVRQPKKLMPA
jgi:hypothetical protein